MLISPLLVEEGCPASWRGGVVIKFKPPPTPSLIKEGE